jgi:hypothetical protein
MMTPTLTLGSAAGGLSRTAALRFVLHLLSLMVFRASCDFFGWRISPLFGVYGVDAKGVPFSNLHWLSLLVVLLVGLVYASYVSRKMDLYDTGLALLFLASYVPVTAVWWISEEAGSYVLFVSIFWALVLALTPAVRRPPAPVGEPGRVQERISLIYVAALLVMGAAILARFGLPTDFGFETAYVRRSEYAAWLPAGPIIYVFSWSVYVFCVYLLFVSRPILHKIIAVAFIALIFAASGDKIYALIVPVLMFAQVVARRGIWLAVPLLASIGVITSAAYFQAGGLWIPSLVQRLLFLPAAIGFNHIERFQEHLLYSYSFLSWAFKYDYHLIPSLLIGEEFYGNNDNATANFTVDAFVNIGWFGLPLLTFFFVWLRQVLAPGPHLIVVIPLFVQLLDTPLPTALLTGGGILMIATAYIVSSSQRPAKGRH